MQNLAGAAVTARTCTGPTRRVGVVGLGAMGAGIARSVRRAGYPLGVYDVRPEAVVAVVDGGGTAYASPADLARDSDVLVCVVVDAAQVDAVLFGADGAAAGLRPGSVFIMCSTIDPLASRAFEERLMTRHVHYLDAPVSGGAAKASAGEITMMTAGRPEAYTAAGAVLEAVSSAVYRLGDRAGNGSKVKIINQLLAGVHIAAAAEAMALGLRAGVPAHDLYEVITHSAGNSWMFEDRMPHVLAGDYAPRSAVNIFVKDLGIVLDTAGSMTAPTPLAAAARQMFLQAAATGHGLEDDSAVIKIFPGLTLPQPSRTATADETARG